MTIYTAAIQQLYVAYMNRPADPAGLAHWEKAAANGLSLDTIAASFSTSNEYITLHEGQTPAQLVQSLYQNLFGRAAEPAGVAHWTKLMDQGLSLSQVANAISNGAQGDDAVSVAAKAAAATAYTTMLSQQTAFTAGLLAERASYWLSSVTDSDSLSVAAASLPLLPGRAASPYVLDVTDDRGPGEASVGFNSGTVEIKVVFSSEVVVNTVKGLPTIVLATGKLESVANYVGGSGTNTLTFQFQVKDGDNAPDLDYVSINALTLNGATIKDAAFRDAFLTLAAPGGLHSLSANGSTVIDTTAPQLLGATPGTGQAAVATNSNITLHFNDKIGNLSNAIFLIEDTAHTHTLIVNGDSNPESTGYMLSADRTSVTLNPAAGLHSGTEYTVRVIGSLTDISGNALAGANGAEAPATLARFTTGDAPEPVYTASAGKLTVSGETSGDRLTIDLGQHAASQGSLPAGNFTTLDSSTLNGTVRVEGTDGAINQITGSAGADTILGGDRTGASAAHNFLRGGAGADTLVAGNGSDNTFQYAVGEFQQPLELDLVKAAETILSWSNARAATIHFDNLTLAAAAHDQWQPDEDYATMVSIDEKGLAHFTDLAVYGDAAAMTLAAARYVTATLADAAAGTSAVFNQGDTSYLVVMTGDTAGGQDSVLIKLVGVHSDGLLFDHGDIVTKSFVA